MFYSKIVSFAFLFLLCNVYSYAQERVSNYEHYSQIESFIKPGLNLELNWKGIDYILSSDGKDLRLQNPNTLHEDPITIDMGMNCGIYSNNYLLIDDFLYITNGSEIREIDLIEQKPMRRFNLIEYGIVNYFFQDNQDGIICKIQTDADVDKMYVRIDLATEELTLTTFQPSYSVVSFNDNLVAFSYDSTEIWTYNLAESTSALIIQGDSFRPLYKKKGEQELLFINGDGQLFAYNSDGQVIEKCSNFHLGKYERAYYDDSFIYKMIANNSGFTIHYCSVFDRNTCEYVDGFPATDNLRYPQYITINGIPHVIFHFNYNITVLNLNTLNVKSYNTPAYHAIDKHIKGNNYYFLWENEDHRFQITKIDMATTLSKTINTYKSDQLSTKVKLNVNEMDQVILTGIFSNKLSSIKYDSNLNYIDEFDIGVTEDFGITFNTSNSWRTDNGRIYSQQNREIHFFDNEWLQKSNEYPYHSSPLLHNGQIFGFINSDNNTYFTRYDIEDDSLILIHELPLTNENFPSQLCVLNGKIYQIKQNDRLIELYPSADIVESQLSTEITSVYHQAEDKILIEARIDGMYRLAWFDGEQFDIVADQETRDWIQSSNQSWRNGSVIKIFVVATEAGLLLYTFDEQTGEVFLHEQFDFEWHTNAFIDQTSNKWKMLEFSKGQDHTIVATNGKKMKLFDLSQAGFDLGSSHVYIYENERLFFTNDNNESYVIDDAFNILELSNDIDNKFIDEVVFIDDRYYFIASDENDIIISEVDQELSIFIELARIKASTCGNINYVEYLGKSIDDKLIFSIPSFDFGTELWSLAYESNEVELIMDMDNSTFSGFKRVQFLQDDKFYFTGIEEGNNTQLYRIDVENTPVSNHEIEANDTQINIHPNPVEDYISFDLPLNQITISNPQGKLIYKGSGQEFKTSIDVAAFFPTGIYYLSGRDKSGKIYRSSFVKI